LIPGLVLFNVFTNDLDDRTEHTLSSAADDTRSGGVADKPAGCADIHRDLDTLEQWAARNHQLSRNGKHKSWP